MDPGRRRIRERTKLSSMEILVLIVGLFAGTIIAWIPIAVAAIDCGDFNAAITDCDDVSPKTVYFPIKDDIQHSVSGGLSSLTV